MIPKRVGWKDTVKILVKHGYMEDKTKGDHLIMHHYTDLDDRITVPKHNPLKPGTFCAIMKKAGLEDQYLEIISSDS
jgi:predicted RNA binding protein YcfA (HicA-like mRNA interferase family)